jgi:bifunctional ADP-heptose synthase (sugar kinase/adenylyltransferase)
LIEQILDSLPNKSVGLLGDLFLDRYLDLDDALTEPSIETGLDAYQVVNVRSNPGALGTVLNNLVALGVGTIRPIALIGDDGEGYELRQALGRLPVVDAAGVIDSPLRRTPTYTKPMLMKTGELPRELNRLDIKNRKPTSNDDEKRIISLLEQLWDKVDAWIVLDQVSETNCGVITASVRSHLAKLAEAKPTQFVLADSRELIAEFRNVYIKPNEHELVSETGPGQHRGIFRTRGAQGIELILPGQPRQHAPGYPVTGPIDIVGAGDSCSAGIICAVMVGATLLQAAAFGNLVASITVQQIGATGTASPQQVRQRWAVVSGRPV